MTVPQFIRSPSGDELVILPKSDYDALVAAAAAYGDHTEVEISDARIAAARDRMTREALEDVDAGRVVDDAAVQAWAEHLGAEQPLPLPVPQPP